jgi:hypothetical protein
VDFPPGLREVENGNQRSEDVLDELLGGGRTPRLLGNLVLDELDRKLERRGHRFVRYDDDQNIYVASERAGPRVMESVTLTVTFATAAFDRSSS